MTTAADQAMFNTDVGLVHTLVHGTASQTITTDNGTLPTFAKQLSISTGTSQFHGDTSITLAATDVVMHYFNQALSVDRTATLPSTGLYDGLQFDFVRYGPIPNTLTAETNSGGTTFYVDYVGGSDTNNGTSTSTPWKTLTKAATRTWAAGDKLLFKRGVTHYTTGYQTLSGTGTSGNRVIVDAYGTGTTPVLENNDNAHTFVIFEAAGSYFTIQNLKFQKTGYVANTNFTEMPIKVTGNNIRISNCDIGGFGYGVALKAGTGHQVDHCYIHDGVMIVNDATANNDYGANGILISGVTNVTINYNRIVNMKATSIDYGVDGSAFEFFDSTDGITIYGNYVDNCVSFAEYGASVNTKTANNTTFRHNVVTNIYTTGFVFHNNTAQTFGYTITNTKVDNNTFIKTSAADTSGAFAAWYTAPPASQFYFRNNIIVWRNCGNLYLTPGSAVHTNNLYWLQNVTANGVTFGATEIQDNPLFYNMNNGDFRLRNTSPAIGQGTNLSYGTDMDGYAVQSTPNIGAYDLRYPTKLTIVDPLGGKNYTLNGNENGCVRYRAVSATEWVIVYAASVPI